MSAKKQAVKELIAKHESGGSYDMAYGGKEIPLTKMTIGEVIAYQEMRKKAGDESTAMGKYQIILKTMKDLSRRNPEDFGEDKLFDAEAQEWAADTLLDRRGWSKFESGEMSDQEMALELSKEWASLPDPSTGRSFYAGDNLNKSHHEVDDVFKVLNVVEARPSGLR